MIAIAKKIAAPSYQPSSIPSVITPTTYDKAAATIKIIRV